MSVLNIAAGVVLILLGMRYLRRGLDRLFGNRLLDWLQQTTVNRWKAFLAGMVAGTVAPSSTSIALLSVQMLSRTALPAGRMLAIVLGANVGITVTVQLLSFHLEDSAAALLIAGGTAYLYLRRPLFRGSGQVLLAFGLIFFAMQLIGAASRSIAGSGDLATLFQVIEHYPWTLLFATAALTVFMQSSTASIALGIGLAQGGLLATDAIVPWVLGTNVGIAATSLIAGWTSVEGRRLGVGNLLLKAAGSVALLLTIPNCASWLQIHWGMPITRAAADLHTGFNLILGLVSLPLLGPLSRLMGFFVETPPENDAEPESYLDPLLLQSPSLALNQSAREEFRMMDELKTMLRTVQTIGDANSLLKLAEIDRHRGHLESIGKRLKIYLGQIADDSLSPADVRWKFILMDYVQELAAVGILIHRDLSDSTRHQAKSKIAMPPEEQADIASVVKKTLARMERATSILMSQDPTQSETFISEKEQMSHWCRQARRSHHERNLVVKDTSWETTSDYLDQLNILRRINSHITSAAYALARPQSAALEASNSTTDANENKEPRLY